MCLFLNYRDPHWEEKRGWLWWPEEILACCLGLGVAAGWEEVTHIKSVHMGLFVGCCFVCLNVIVAADIPTSNVFGQLLHDSTVTCLISVCKIGSLLAS